MTQSMLTRDGVRLDADVYRPNGAGPYPVLLMRHAYGRQIAGSLCYAPGAWYAARGYIVVVQDVRGRGSSEGCFEPFIHEAEDGVDTIAWAAGLEGADGKVGMFGFSYQGVNQFLAAALAGPELKAIAPAMASWNIRDDWAYEGGAFNLTQSLGWAVQLAAENARLAGDLDAYAHLRVLAWPTPMGGANPARPTFLEPYRKYTHYYQWLDEPEGSPYWQDIAPSARLDALRHRACPTLLIGGWFDSHLDGALAAYRALKDTADVRLHIGPWLHLAWSERAGAVDFGPAAASDVDDLQIRWFDYWLKDIDDGIAEDPPITLFDMGEHSWRGFGAWPQAAVALRLSSSGRAAINSMDGVLQAEAPADGSVDELVHDPWRPAPAVGGASGSPYGVIDRSGTDARPDILTYTTAPLTDPLALAGDVAAELHIETTSAGFDVGCVLSRVTMAGAAYQLSEGYRSARSDAGPMVRVDLRPTCANLQAGERLRLSIFAAAFPAHPVNPGDGRRPEDSTLDSAGVITLRLAAGSLGGSRLILSTDGGA